MAMNLLLAIRSLNAGGAEKQMILLAKNLAKLDHKITLVIFYNGVWDSEIKNIENLELVCLEKRGRYDIASPLIRYAKIVKNSKFDAIYSFLPEMNIFTTITKFLVRDKTKHFWGIRASNMISQNSSFVSQKVLQLQSFLSRSPTGIIFNSHSGKEHHLNSGFRPKKSFVVFNGIDTEFYKIDQDLRNSFRQRYNADNKIIVGIAARIDPMKGLEIFAEMSKIIADQNLLFFVAGDGDQTIKKRCIEINNQIIWLGNQKDLREFYNGIDILVSSSLYGEGFSNSIAEGMSCGACAIATDVGDSASIALDGLAVVPNNAQKLAEKVLKTINDMPSRELARAKIVDNFSSDQLISNSLEILRDK